MAKSEKPESACPQGDLTCRIGVELAELKEKIEWLSQQVNTDSLTQLFNRRHLDNTLEQEIERTQRSGIPGSIAILDADHFKKLNDSHGHLAGDKALIHIASIIKSSIRKIDICCRYGGEEFAIIFPSTPPVLAVQVAERIRQSIASTTLKYNDKSLSMTVSAGLTVFNNTAEDTAEKILARADSELYRAKEEGRNRVCCSAPERKVDAEVSQSEKDALFDAENEDHPDLDHPP